jgi:hypothetical protein
MKAVSRVPKAEVVKAEKEPKGAVVLYVVAMVATIVGVDIAFFRNRFWERLTVNVGIVSVFAAFYLTFFRRPIAGGHEKCTEMSTKSAQVSGVSQP